MEIGKQNSTYKTPVKKMYSKFNILLKQKLLLTVQIKTNI